MKYVVTGAAGNTGERVVRRLVQLGRGSVIAVVRSDDATARLKALGADVIRADLQWPETLAGVFDSETVLVETANLRFAQALLPILEKRGVFRAFCVTTTGVYSRYNDFARLYREIESQLRNSHVNITLLRPSMIYGNEQDKNIHKLLRYLDRLSVYPVFGDGQSLMQPVHVEDLADGVIAAITRNASGEFNLCGPAPLSYRELVTQAAKALDRNITFVHVPARPVALMAKFLNGFSGFPISEEQILRLQENKAFDISFACDELAYRPRSFSKGVAQEVARLRTLGMLRS